MIQDPPQGGFSFSLYHFDPQPISPIGVKLSINDSEQKPNVIDIKRLRNR